MTETATKEPKAKAKTRAGKVRVGRTYQLQQHQSVTVVVGQSEDGTMDTGPLEYWKAVGPVFQDTAEAKKHIRDKALEGKFRVVAITWEGKSTTQQITKVTLE